MSRLSKAALKLPNVRTRKSSPGKIPIVDLMYQALLGAITEHRVLPGTKLREDELAEAFAVSRTPVREVLQRLHQVGVVDLHPNRGAFVAKPSVRRARETFDARIILESGIFRRVAGCVQAKDLKLLREVIELEERALDSGDRNALIRYTGEFHITLCNVLGNEELNRMLRELVSRTSVALAVFPPSGFVSADSKHHRKIVACLEKRDGEGAVETLVTTLKEVQRSLDFEFATKKKDELREIVSQMMERNQ